MYLSELRNSLNTLIRTGMQSLKQAIVIPLTELAANVSWTADNETRVVHEAYKKSMTA